MDGDFKLAESIAILRYLDTKYPMSELYPKEPQQRARIDEFLEWQHLGLRLNLSNHFRLRFIQPILHSKPVDERELAQATKLRDSSLKYFEKNWLDQSKFIIGDSPTIADLFAACEIEQTRKLKMKYFHGRWKKNLKKFVFAIFRLRWFRAWCWTSHFGCLARIS